jgi:protease-4
MQAQREPSAAGRFFRGLWRVINGTRLVVLNLVFFFVLLLILAAAFAPSEKVQLQGQSTLVLQPQGVIVEEFTSGPLDRALQEAIDQGIAETRLRDLVKAIERGSKDSRITQMLIDTDGMLGIGLASLLDLEEAVATFQATGKPVIAMGRNMSQHQYFLAALADEVWLVPDGTVWIDGYANMRNFFAEGLDKLAVTINLFRVGEYKSAMEPFIRSDMSPEAQEASLEWLGSLWQTWLEGVSGKRGILPEVLAARLNEMPDRVTAAGGSFSAFAMEAGLVDRLISAPEARQELAVRGAPNGAGDGYRAISHRDYLKLTNLPAPLIGRYDVKILVAEGEIVSGTQGPGFISADTMSEQLRQIGRDDQVKALVLRINSPGGDAQASEQIRRELQALQDLGKTVVVSMGDVAASGGYWIAMSANEIWASPSTITGSIGVFGLLPTFEGTLQKMGIYTDGVGTTPLAGKLRVDRPLDPAVAAMFQASTERVYGSFIEKVATFRGMSIEQADRYARGRVWSGAQARQHGLVDQLGGLDEAVDAAARIAGLGSDFSAGYHDAPLTPFEAFFAELGAEAMARLPMTRGAVMLAPTGFLGGLLADLERVVARNGRFTVAAHCLCEVR